MSVTSARDASGGMRILAVDDEPRALADLTRMLRIAPGVSEVRGAGDGDAALREATHVGFDAVFLDVRMPGLDGVELARVLRRFAGAPELVFVSAHEDAAVDAFELRALDYLRKPVARRRVIEAVARVRSARDASNGPAAAWLHAPDEPLPPREDVVAVSALRGGATRLLKRSEIRYVHSHGDFVRIVTGDGRYLLRVTLSEIERRFEAHGFVRVHRQYVVNLRQAVELRPQLGGTAELAFADGTTVPVARRHASALVQRLGAA